MGDEGAGGPGTQLDVNGRLRRFHAGRLADRIKDYGAGRLCEVPGCATRLSIYNPERRCALHEAPPVTCSQWHRGLHTP
jgi:hypothetical protein